MKKQLPEYVKSTSLYLQAEKNHDLYDVSCKLIANKEDLINMWITLEKRSQFTYDDVWVWAYLGTVAHYSKQPPYYVISNRNRQKLSNKIKNLTAELEKLYVDYKLDFRLVAANGKIFNGFYILDDFSDKNKEGFESEKDVQKGDFIPILRGAAERASRLILESQHNGKAGENVKAIRLIRSLYKYHIQTFHTPLNQILATVSNYMFDTNFNESDIRKLIDRVGN